jgi:hypothetical protein
MAPASTSTLRAQAVAISWDRRSSGRTGVDVYTILPDEEFRALFPNVDI